jgi:hypothetical protein
MHKLLVVTGYGHSIMKRSNLNGAGGIASKYSPHSFPLHVVVADGAFVKAVTPAAFGFYCAQPFCRRPATQSHARSQLLEERKLLPVHQASADLREILALHGVVIIVGETGSGKTTQVGQPSHRALCCRLTCPYRCRSCCTKWDSLGWV